MVQLTDALVALSKLFPSQSRRTAAVATPSQREHASDHPGIVVKRKRGRPRKSPVAQAAASSPQALDGAPSPQVDPLPEECFDALVMLLSELPFQLQSLAKHLDDGGIGDKRYHSRELLSFGTSFPFLTRQTLSWKVRKQHVPVLSCTCMFVSVHVYVAA